VTWKVVDPDGKAVAQATVALARTGSGNSLTGDTRYCVKTKDDGTYRVCLPASGKVQYNLIAHDGSYNKWCNYAADVSEPMRTTNVATATTIRQPRRNPMERLS
jgi:hypothetical protein